MHRTAADRPGWTLCGRQLDAAEPVYPDVPRRAFSICVGCRTAGAEYPIPAPSRAPQRATAGSTTIERRGLGWVQLPQPPQVLHRPDPYVPDRVLCGKVLQGTVPIHRTPPQSWPACPDCQAKIQGRLRRQQQSAEQAAGQRGRPVAPLPRQRRASERIRRRLAAGPVLGARPTGMAGTWRLPVGWVQFRGLWHRPHPEQPDQVMCELTLPAAAPVYRRRTANEPLCPDCNAVRSAALAELRAQDRQRALPAPAGKRSRRSDPSPPRIQIVRGGLPTLGRDR